MLSVLVDTNVVLDFALGREPWAASAQEILRAAADERLRVVFPATSLKDVCSVAQEAMGKSRAEAFVDYLLEICAIAPVDAGTCLLARAEKEEDFEDGIVAAIAREQAVDVIVSRDEHAFKNACAPKMNPRLFADFFLRADARDAFFEACLDTGQDRSLENPAEL